MSMLRETQAGKHIKKSYTFWGNMLIKEKLFPVKQFKFWEIPIWRRMNEK